MSDPPIVSLAIRTPTLPAPAEWPEDLRLISLPNEILITIFGKLDECPSVCVGLASRKMYHFHRLNYDYPINLFTQSRYMFLHQHIEEWMGPKYRWSECYEGFVKRAVYGDFDSEKEFGRLVRFKNQVAKMEKRLMAL